MKPLRIALLLVWTAAWVLIASPAEAVDETVGSCVVETLEELGGAESFEATVAAGDAAESGDDAYKKLKEAEEELEGCLEAPSPILPELTEIIWGGLAFAVLMAVMAKYAFPLVKSGMEGRTEKIRTDLQSAQSANEEAAKLKAQNEAELAQAKANANKLLDEARQEAAALKSDLQAKAEVDILDMRRRAATEVSASRQRALADLQSEVNEIVVGAAEVVVEHNLDPATQRQLIENYISNVGTR